MGNLTISMQDSFNPLKAQRIRRLEAGSKRRWKRAQAAALEQIWHSFAR
jgi:hypothetical protein